jgi:hypothetical protein
MKKLNLFSLFWRLCETCMVNLSMMLSAKYCTTGTVPVPVILNSQCCLAEAMWSHMIYSAGAVSKCIFALLLGISQRKGIWCC